MNLRVWRWMRRKQLQRRFKMNYAQLTQRDYLMLVPEILVNEMCSEGTIFAVCSVLLGTVMRIGVGST